MAQVRVVGRVLHGIRTPTSSDDSRRLRKGIRSPIGRTTDAYLMASGRLEAPDHFSPTASGRLEVPDYSRANRQWHPDASSAGRLPARPNGIRSPRSIGRPVARDGNGIRTLHVRPCVCSPNGIRTPRSTGLKKRRQWHPDASSSGPEQVAQWHPDASKHRTHQPDHHGIPAPRSSGRECLLPTASGRLKCRTSGPTQRHPVALEDRTKGLPISTLARLKPVAYLSRSDVEQ